MPEFASRSANMDRYIQDFLRRKPGGVIAELGCGLETTFYRNDNGHTRWLRCQSAGCDGISKDTAPGTGTTDILCRRCLFR